MDNTNNSRRSERLLSIKRRIKTRIKTRIKMLRKKR